MADAKPFHWEFVPEPVAQEVFRVEGGRPLVGKVAISGSKNAALKMLAAATLTGERCRFTNVPEIEDVRVMAETLRDLGVVVDHPANNVYEVASGDVEWLFVPLEAAAKMRASFMLLGPLLARFGRVIISNPGGDRIGRRPVNLHVDAMRALGAEIDYRNGYYFATAPGRLRGGEVRFPFVSVMGTENAMLAATLADGHTVIRPAAEEPEVDDLMALLQKMGAQIERTDHDALEVDGSALADRGFRAVDIETGPYPGLATDLQPPTSVLLTQAKGASRVNETIFEDRLEWMGELRRMGADVEILDPHTAVITGRAPLHGADVEIGDLRAGASLILAALAADGETTIHGAHHVHRGYENIEGKFLELGARIERLAEGTDLSTS